MAYDYGKSPSKDFKINTKYALVLILCVFFVFLFFFVSGRVTAYATYTQDLESELNKTESELTSTRTELGNCQLEILDKNYSIQLCEDKMSRSEFYLTACEKRRDELLNYSSSLNDLLGKCEAESKNWKSSYENETATRKALVKNSVKIICCSPYDISKSIVKSWDIIDNSIVCDSGNYNVNCASGETNY